MAEAVDCEKDDFNNTIRTANVLILECNRIHKEKGYSSFNYDDIVAMVNEALKPYRLTVVFDAARLKYFIEPMTFAEVKDWHDSRTATSI